MAFNTQKKESLANACKNFKTIDLRVVVVHVSYKNL